MASGRFVTKLKAAGDYSIDYTVPASKFVSPVITAESVDYSDINTTVLITATAVITV